ncbi:MAG: hypothetical protein Q7O66_08695, partial [Dehalococcoidia bacterium]|nr:hypothetical protein [Dehalococcoidia bacterium]
MAADPVFRDQVIEMLAPIGEISSRPISSKMRTGWSIWRRPQLPSPRLCQRRSGGDGLPNPVDQFWSSSS